MIHIFAAIGVEAGDDGTERAFSEGRMSTGIGTDDRLRRFGGDALSSLDNSVERAAHAPGLIDGGSSASAKTTQYHAAGALGVLNGTTAAAARPLRHSDLIAEFTIAANVDAIEPSRVKELAHLHVESHGDRFFVAYGIGRRAAATTAAEVDGHALARDVDGSAIMIAVAILIGVLRCSQGGESDQK